MPDTYSEPTASRLNSMTNSLPDRTRSAPCVKSTIPNSTSDWQSTTTMLAEKFVDCFVDTVTIVLSVVIGIAAFFGGLLIISM